MTTYRNEAGRFAGRIQGDVYIKNVSFRKHLMRIFNAVGIDEGIITSIYYKCKWIVVTDIDSGNVYTVSITKFQAYNFIREFGHGKQYFLPLKYWDKKGA